MIFILRKYLLALMFELFFHVVEGMSLELRIMHLF